MTECDVTIIGAGPYGLSIAAHLKALGVDFRIFGIPMDFWLKHMPEGMHLKSEGFASSLYDPDSTFTLESYCTEKGMAYARTGMPVPLEVFSSYGLEFQKRFVPELENKLVESVQRSGDGFRVCLEDGEVISSRRVVIAVGLTHYQHVPPILAPLPEELVTHSSRHHFLDQFKGREVAIVGGGASALDLAALLYQTGAQVQVIVRQPAIRFHDPPDERKPSLIDQLRRPMTGIGPGWRLFWYVNAPLLFRQMPQEYRLDKVRRVLGPAPCWFTKEQVIGKVTLNVGTSLTEAKVENGRVNLQLTDRGGSRRTIAFDHVITATGYKVDLRRLPLIDTDLQSKLQCVDYTPVLSSHFESSVPGLYFVGASSANTFGPLVRFAYGAGFTSGRISKHLAKSTGRRSVSRPPKANVEANDRDRLVAR